MTTYRTSKKKDYTMIKNLPIRDVNLSWDTLGLLTYFLMMPDDWRFNVSHLMSIGKNEDGDDFNRKAGRTRIDRMIQELEEYGYVNREQEKLPDGTFGDIIFDVYEDPRRNQPFVEKTKKILGKSSDSADAGKANTEDQQLPITNNILNTNNTLSASTKVSAIGNKENPSSLADQTETDTNVNGQRPTLHNDTGKVVVPQSVLTELENYFIEITNLTPPHRETAALRRSAGARWTVPLRLMFLDAGTDLDKTKQIMNDAVERQKHLTYDSPSGIYKTFRSLLAQYAGQSDTFVVC